MLTLVMGAVNPLVGQELPNDLARVAADLDRGDVDEAVRRIRHGCRASPGDPRWGRLGRMLDALEQPGKPSEAGPDPGLPGLAPRPIVSAHREGWYADGDSAWDELLERVVLDFYIRWTMLGVELRPIDRRLVVVQLDGPRSYARYLRDEGADAFQGTTGFAHPARPWLVLFDLNRLDESPEMVGQLRGLDRRAVAVGTAAHEMVHLLVRASGLGPSPSAFPRWLHEGIAMQYEPAPGGVWIGPGSAESPRLDDWFRRAESSHVLLPLVRDDGLAGGYNSARYAEAWALVHFLLAEHPARFVAFLDVLRVPRIESEPEPNRFEAAFLEVFGPDLDRLQRDWRAHVRRLRPGSRADLRLPR